MHTFLHFVVSLQSRFYTLGLIFVFDVNIYSSSLRLCKIDPVVSLLQATHGQYFIVALSLPLRRLRVTFILNTFMIVLKELFFRPVTKLKDLTLTSLCFHRYIARTEDFRKRYPYLLKVLDKICCLRQPIRN